MIDAGGDRPPEWLDGEMVTTAVERAGARNRPARLDDVRLQTLTEGTCVQTLHIGSFDDEAAVLETMHRDVIPARGLQPAGTHHEVYLSDFRRVPPAKQRTILRQPITPAG